MPALIKVNGFFYSLIFEMAGEIVGNDPRFRIAAGERSKKGGPEGPPFQTGLEFGGIKRDLSQ